MTRTAKTEMPIGNDIQFARKEHCYWCSTPFRPRRSGGSRQVFCCPSCRHALDRAARRLVRRALAGGALSIEELRSF